MGRKSEKLVIGSYEYEVTQLGGKEGRRLGARLGKVFVRLASGGADVNAGLLHAFAGIDEDLVDLVCDKLSECTTVKMQNGKQPRLSDIFDEHFAGNYGEMLLWLRFAIRVNFESFLAVSHLVPVESDQSE
jgi:hypothetical protein